MKTCVFIFAVCVCALSPGWVGAACWDQIASGTSAQALMKVDFVDEQLGWAVQSSGLNSGAIIHTTNGGVNWTVQYSANYRIENVDFVDANNGWAVGYYSIFHTTDGGQNWTRTVVDHAVMLGVSFTDVNNGWIVGDDLSGGNSPIWHTTNGGANWTTQSSGTIYGLNEVAFGTASNGVAVGLGGVILNTTNGGTTWTSQASGTTYNLSGVAMIDQGFACAVGAHGTVLGTLDGGTTWGPAVTVGTTAYLYDVAFNGANGWVVGDSSLILSTTSLGMVWSRSHTNTVMYPLLLGVTCVGERAWAVGYDTGSLNEVWRNTCPVPQHFVVQFTPERFVPPHGYFPSVVALNWSPVAAIGDVNYNVYEDSVFTGNYSSLVGTTTDTTYLIWFGGNDPRRFYIVKSDEP